MPTYGYACACGARVDRFCSISEYLGTPGLECPVCGAPMVRQYDECQIIGDELKSAKVIGRSGQLETHHGDRFEVALNAHIESKSHLRRVLKERGLVHNPDRVERSPRKRRTVVNPQKDLAAIARLVPGVRRAREKAAREGRVVTDVSPGWKPAPPGGVIEPAGGDT